MHCFTSASFVIAFQNIYALFLGMKTWSSMRKCKNQPNGEVGPRHQIVCAGIEDPSVALSQEIHMTGYLPF